MPNRILAIGPVCTALLLAACGSETEDVPVDDDRAAEGEVLGGSISDAMIPLDQLKSQSPPLREDPASGDGEASASDAQAAPTQGETDEPGEAEPAAAQPADEG